MKKCAKFGKFTRAHNYSFRGFPLISLMHTFESYDAQDLKNNFQI